MPERLAWTGISNYTPPVFSSETFRCWKGALENFGEKMIAFRQRDKRGENTPGEDYHTTKRFLQETTEDFTLPKRAGFGMPYTQTYRSLDRKSAIFTPVWGKNCKTEGRRASPLFVKVGKLANREFFWYVVLLPSQFLPDNAKVRGERKRGRTAFADPVLFDDPGPYVQLDKAQTEFIHKMAGVDFVMWLNDQ